MSEKSGIISFDLKHGHWETIDLARMYPLARIHIFNHNWWRRILDNMKQKRNTPDLSVRMKLSVSRFRTLETLDIALERIRYLTAIVPSKIQTRWKWILKIIDPLYIPYSSVDVRKYQKRTSSLRYPDLFKRSLPYKLLVRRSVKITRKCISKNRRPIIIAFSWFVLCSLPLLYFVKFSIESWYNELKSLSHATWSSDIRHHALMARGHFERAWVVFLPFSWIPIDTVDLANHALRGWLATSRAIDTIARTLPTDTGSLISIPKSQDILPTFRWKAQDIFTLSFLWIESPTTWIKDNAQSLRQAEDYFKEASKVYSSTSGESYYSQKFKEVWWILDVVTQSLDWYISNESHILSLLWDDAPKRYMIFNQNRDEIHANGGFPGTIITLTLYKWNILDYRKDDVYYFDWNLYPYKELPPPGVALLTDNYGLRDVNYYPDFRMTLEKANSFIERSGDSTITTWIAIHQWLIEDILWKTWPVTVSWITIPFEKDNFSALMSTLVEAQYGRENHAKDILFSFIDAFVLKIHETNSYMDVIESIRDYWKNWEILFASRDEATDEFLSEFRKKLPWECEDIMSDTCPKNWAYPLFTSVSWNKSDRYIDRTYRSTTTKILGCKYENLVTLTNTHVLDTSKMNSIKSYLDSVWIIDKEEREKYLFIQWNGKNKAFVRLYVPLWSELALEWKDIQVESNEHATVFSFALDTPVWWSASKTIRYTTNIPNCQNFSGEVDWYRQPWLRNVIEK